MSFRGIDVLESLELDRLFFVASLKNSAGAILTTGTTTLRIYELLDAGTLNSYDFNDNTFKATALTTETLAMTHRQGNNNTTDTGLWTATLTTLTGFTRGNKYIYTVNNTGATPAQQERMFQFGGEEGDTPLRIFGSVLTDGSNTASTFKTDLSAAAGTDRYKRAFLTFRTGALIDETDKVSAFNPTTDFITVAEGFTAAPSNGDKFMLVFW